MSDPVKVIYDRDERRAERAEPDSIKNPAEEARIQARPTIAAFKDQASDAAREAKTTVAALAGEARTRFAGIVDQQKAMGADHVAGVARAAQAAAEDLQQTSPQLARLVKSAADSVDDVARNIRGSDVMDVVASVTDFARRRPTAFFGGAVVAGFLLARFLKSDTPAV